MWQTIYNEGKSFRKDSLITLEILNSPNGFLTHKSFFFQHLYNKHILSNHENDESSDTKDFHCDCCEVDFFGPSAMIYHNKFFHRQDTELPSIGQSKKVKTYNQVLLLFLNT